MKLALLVALLGGCLKNAAYPCAQDVDCARGGEQGVCEPATGFCSFTDPSCGAGRRYGELSGSLANTCVGEETTDAMPVDQPDAPPGCFGVNLVQVCPDVTPTTALVLTGSIDTDNSGLCQTFTSTTNTAACLVTGTTVSVSGQFRATGGKPLVIVATMSLTVEAATAIDVSSVHLGPSIGAGGDSASCTAGTDATLGGTGGGGWGGSFGGVGGNGGNGGAPGAGGIAAAAGTSGGLRGGCRGGLGAGTNAGTGGHGGGAVYAIAGTMIQIAGAIDASGSGGIGALADNSQPGGGGGGSGGMIGLEAPMVIVSGSVFANGGGGGEGSGTGFAGVDGGESAAPNTAGLGGVGIGDPTLGGNGGDGSAAATLTGAVGMPDDSDGGGGGGGGAGLVKVFSGMLTNTGSIAPPPS